MTAITMYREMGMQFWMQQAEVETSGLARRVRGTSTSTAHHFRAGKRGSARWCP
jgi:hypothetical protein